jgi:hypothetical protein
VFSLYRALAACAFIGFFASSAYCADDAKSPASKEVIALRDWIIALNGGDSDIDPTVNIFAALQMRVIGGSDETWKRGNPNWTPVFNRIRDDLKQDLRPVLSAQARESAAFWDRTLATHLSGAEIEGLTRFYGSTVGRRYLVFQKRLTAIQSEGGSALMVGLASGGTEPGRAAVAPATQTQIESRQRVIALSWTSQLRPVLASSDSPGQRIGVNEKQSINEAMDRALVQTRGPELDALFRDYEQDLDDYSTFHASPQAKALLAVYGALATGVGDHDQTSSAQIAFKSALERSVQVHTPTWKAAYEAGRGVVQPAAN